MSSMSAVSLTSIWILAEMAGSRRNAKSASGRRSKSFFRLPRDLPITSPGSLASRSVPMPSANRGKHYRDLDENGYLTASNEELAQDGSIRRTH